MHAACTATSHVRSDAAARNHSIFGRTSREVPCRPAHLRQLGGHHDGGVGVVALAHVHLQVSERSRHTNFVELVIASRTSTCKPKGRLPAQGQLRTSSPGGAGRCRAACQSRGRRTCRQGGLAGCTGLDMLQGCMTTLLHCVGLFPPPYRPQLPARHMLDCSPELATAQREQHGVLGGGLGHVAKILSFGFWGSGGG